MTSSGEHVFRASALAALVACLVATGVAIAQKAVPSWDGSALVLFCALASIEAYLAFRIQLGPGASITAGSLRTSLVHAAVFIILAQLYVDTLRNRAPLADGQPYVNAGAFAYFLPVLAVWLAVTGVMRPLTLLERPPEHGFLDTSPVRILTVRFFVAGIALFAASALIQPEIARLFKLPYAAAGGPLLNVLAYFFIGIVVLGRLEYAALQHRWRSQHTIISTGMAARWTRYVLLFTAAVAFLAFVLPTNRTLGILGPGHDALDQLVLLLRGPLSSLLSLIHPSHPTIVNPHLKPPPNFHLPPRKPPAPHHGGGSGGSWLALIQTVLFWTGALALAGYLLWTYLRHGRRRLRRPRLPRRLAGVRGALGRFWAALTGRLRALVDSVVDRLPDSVAARIASPAFRWRRGVDVGAVGGPVRQQILAYYHRMVRRSRRQGIPVRPAHTPQELASLLVPTLPQAEADVETLTEAYVEARYSRHTIPDSRLSSVRTAWEHIRHAYRRVSR
jgi:hypothetical protein